MIIDTEVGGGLEFLRKNASEVSRERCLSIEIHEQIIGEQNTHECPKLLDAANFSIVSLI